MIKQLWFLAIMLTMAMVPNKAAFAVDKTIGPLCAITGIIGLYKSKTTRLDEDAEEDKATVTVGKLYLTSVAKITDWDFGDIKVLKDCPKKDTQVDFIMPKEATVPRRGACVNAMIQHGGVGEIAGYDLEVISELNPDRVGDLCGKTRRKYY